MLCTQRIECNGDLHHATEVHPATGDYIHTGTYLFTVPNWLNQDWLWLHGVTNVPINFEAPPLHVTGAGPCTELCIRSVLKPGCWFLVNFWDMRNATAASISPCMGPEYEKSPLAPSCRARWSGSRLSYPYVLCGSEKRVTTESAIWYK